MNPPILGYDHEMDAVLRVQDSTIHFFGEVPPFAYYRFSTQAETLGWVRPVDGLHNDCWAPHIRLGPDGTPWAAITNTRTGGWEILLVRFGEDTSQIVHYIDTGGVTSVVERGFDIDSSYHFHFLIGSDTVEDAYALFDSSLQLQEWTRLRPGSSVDFSDLKTDAAGNTIMVWSTGGLVVGLRWAFRRADGVWTHPPQAVDSTRDGHDYSLVIRDTMQFAFTTNTAPWPGDYPQLWLYTYGFPPDTTPPNAATPKVAAPPVERISAYPNPFSSSLRLDIPNGQKRTVILYDILGREVWAQDVLDGVHTVSVTDPHLTVLPSGTYFLALRGNSHCVPLQITHFK
jgi:hypothetical protein